MDQMRLMDFLLALVSAGLGWWAKVMWDAVRELRRDLRELENGIPREYVRKTDWDRATDRISAEIHDLKTEVTGRMDAIWLKIDGKADKGSGLSD